MCAEVVVTEVTTLAAFKGYARRVVVHGVDDEAVAIALAQDHGPEHWGRRRRGGGVLGAGGEIGGAHHRGTLRSWGRRSGLQLRGVL